MGFDVFELVGTWVEPVSLCVVGAALVAGALYRVVRRAVRDGIVDACHYLRDIEPVAAVRADARR